MEGGGCERHEGTKWGGTKCAEAIAEERIEDARPCATAVGSGEGRLGNGRLAKATLLASCQIPLRLLMQFAFA